MTLIDIITDSPSQKMILKLENGKALDFLLWYSFNQQGWFYSFTYGTYTVNNRRMVNSINLLRALRNVIPFGLSCILTDNYEPVFLSDFKNGRAKLYTLNSNDVVAVENILKSLQ